MISTHPCSASEPPFDIILISGEFYADHPHSGIGVIARVLDEEGYRVGIIEKPDWTDFKVFLRLGLPRLFFGVSSGAVDSMLQNYTPLKNLRKEDPYNPYDSQIPDRAVIVYSHKLRQADNWARKHWPSERLAHIKPQSTPIVLGGVEASLRRFTHYDYWDNDLRRPILLDSKADILVYGPGEYQIKTIASRYDQKQPIYEIEGTSVVLDSPPKSLQNQIFEALPSFKSVSDEKEQFCKMHLMFSNQKNLYQQVENKWVVQYRMHNYTTAELDAIYDLPFTYDIPEKYSELEMAKFSIITHRGCIGNCNFCSIALHQGDKIISRTPDNIYKEIQKISKLPQFKGNIGDLGGPSANMYGMDCKARTKCTKDCISCPNLNRSHQTCTQLLKKARSLPRVKKVFVRSGIRYDLAVDADEYLWELRHHISGNLKIAPEHFSPHLCKLMNKPNDRFEEFKSKFEQINQPLRQNLKYYFITAHPGSTMKDAYVLREKISQLGEYNTESIQIFTPTPMSLSTCMYYTGLNPYTLEKIYVPYTYHEKKKQKRVLYPKDRNLSKSKSYKKSEKKNKKSTRIRRIEWKE